MTLMIGRTMAAIHPKKTLVTKIESAPVSGAVIRKDIHADRDAPLFRISATTGTTEQLQSGMGTPNVALVNTDLKLSLRNHLRTSSREISTCNTPARNNPNNSMGAKSRNDFTKKSKNPRRKPWSKSSMYYIFFLRQN